MVWVSISWVWSRSLFSSTHERMRCKGHKQKHKRFCLSIKQNCLTRSMTKNWHCFIREPGESFEILKCYLDLVLDKQALGNHVWAETLDKMPEVIFNIFQTVIHAKVWRKWFRHDKFAVSSKSFHWITLLTDQNRLAIRVRPPWNVPYFKVLFPKYYPLLLQNKK